VSAGARGAPPRASTTTSALVAVLAADADPGATRARIEAHGDFEAGPLAGRRLPLVQRSAGARAGERTLRWLEREPGVAHVEIVLVGWDERPPTPETRR